MADKDKAPGAEATDPKAEKPNTVSTADTTTPATPAAPPNPDGGVVVQAQQDATSADPAPDADSATDADAELADADAGLVGSIADVDIDAQAEKLDKNDAAQRQFPSLVGQPEVEVAQRSTDVQATGTSKHRKTYVLLREQYNARTFDHVPNINATRQFMLDYGLRPVGDVKFAGSERHPDGVSVRLHYEGEAVPAVVATAPAVNNMVVAQK